MVDFDIETYVEGLKLELSFSTDETHKADILAEIARVQKIGTAAESAAATAARLDDSSAATLDEMVTDRNAADLSTK